MASMPRPNRRSFLRASAVCIGLPLLVLAVVMLIQGLLVSWLLTRSITGPLANAVRFAREVASGDLTATIHSDRRDETGQLIDALQTMVTNLSMLVTGVRTATDHRLLMLRPFPALLERSAADTAACDVNDIDLAMFHGQNLIRRIQRSNLLIRHAAPPR